MPTPQTLYRMYDRHGHLLYVGITTNFGRRMSQHEADKPWYHLVTRYDVEKYPSRELVENAERHAINKQRPIYNIVHNRQSDTTDDAPRDGGWTGQFVTGDVRQAGDGCSWQARFNECKTEPFMFLTRIAAGRWLKNQNARQAAEYREEGYGHFIEHGGGFPPQAALDGTIERLTVDQITTVGSGANRTVPRITLRVCEPTTTNKGGDLIAVIDVVVEDHALLYAFATTKPSEGDLIRIRLNDQVTTPDPISCACKWELTILEKAVSA